jgi:hypothetical protein
VGFPTPLRMRSGRGADGWCRRRELPQGEPLSKQRKKRGMGQGKIDSLPQKLDQLLERDARSHLDAIYRHSIFPHLAVIKLT